MHLERLFFLFYLSRWAYLAQIAWYRRENDTIAAPRRYVQYFICIRTEEMARTLMFLADASRKAFLYLPSFLRRLIWMRPTYLPTSPQSSFSPEYSPTATVTPWHTFPLPFADKKSRCATSNKLSQPSANTYCNRKNIEEQLRYNVIFTSE